MEMIVDPKGVVRCVYAEDIDLTVLGVMHIRRASHVEPDATGKWWSDLSPTGGPRLGPFDLRSQALHAERQWLDNPSPDGTGQQLGVVYDARGACGRYGYSATVFLTNVFFLPPTQEQFFALPKCVYDTTEEMAEAGWTVD